MPLPRCASAWPPSPARGSFLERELRRAVLKELTLQLEANTGPIVQAEPRAARELLWQFLELGNNVLGRCDDSSGLLGDGMAQSG